jgi:hypothetical protein
MLSVSAAPGCRRIVEEKQSERCRITSIAIVHDGFDGKGNPGVHDFKFITHRVRITERSIATRRAQQVFSDLPLKRRIRRSFP